MGIIKYFREPCGVCAVDDEGCFSAAGIAANLIAREGFFFYDNMGYAIFSKKKRRACAGGAGADNDNGSIELGTIHAVRQI